MTGKFLKFTSHSEILLQLRLAWLELHSRTCLQVGFNFPRRLKTRQFQTVNSQQKRRQTAEKGQLSISQHLGSRDFRQVTYPTFPPSRRMVSCQSVCVRKRLENFVSGRGKHNRCLRVPTGAADTDLTFTQK